MYGGYFPDFMDGERGPERPNALKRATPPESSRAGVCLNHVWFPRPILQVGKVRYRLVEHLLL